MAGSLKSVRKYFKRYWLRLCGGVLFVAASNIFAVLSPVVVRNVLDGVTGSINSYRLASGNLFDASMRRFIFDSVLWTGLLLLGLALLRGLFMYLMRQTIIVMSRHIEYDQKNDLYGHLQTMHSGFFRQWPTGDLMNRISEDVARVRQYTGPAVMYSINLTVLSTLCIAAMIRVSPMLTLFVVAPLPVLATVIFYVNKIINLKSGHIQEQLSGLTTAAQESYSGIRVIKSFVQEPDTSAFFEQQSDRYKTSAVNLSLTEAIYFPGMNLFIGLSLIGTVGIGGYFVMQGSITAGNIAEFVMYLNLLLFPISSIGWVASITQRAAASQKRIDQLLQAQPEIINRADTMDNGPLSGFDVSMVDVSFTYPHTGILALSHFSLQVSAGQKVCILGRTGSGKSTIAQLLLRLYDPQEGAVMIGGKDIRDLDLHTLRRSISYAPQASFLFSDTIRENIRFGQPEADNASVDTAVHRAALDNDLAQLTNGYDTMIGEGGVMLSGGQKQRTVLARALVKDCDIILLDETLSAVDTQTEQLILQRMKAGVEGKTVIVITHRIFASWDFDQIIMMEDGRIAEQGTHAALMQQQGAYAKLYRHQTEVPG